MGDFGKEQEKSENTLVKKKEKERKEKRREKPWHNLSVPNSAL